MRKPELKAFHEWLDPSAENVVGASLFRAFMGDCYCHFPLSLDHFSHPNAWHHLILMKLGGMLIWVLVENNYSKFRSFPLSSLAFKTLALKQLGLMCRVEWRVQGYWEDLHPLVYPQVAVIVRAGQGGSLQCYWSECRGPSDCATIICCLHRYINRKLDGKWGQNLI